MAEAKEIVLGLGAIALVAGAFSPDPHAPEPPPICNVPQADGSTIQIPVTSIPCDKMVQDALTALEAARSIQVPETVKIESYPGSTADAPSAPIGNISEEENRVFTEPYEEKDGSGEEPVSNQSEEEQKDGSSSFDYGKKG